MILELVKQWEENKHKLEEYFKTTKQNQYDSYEVIVKKIFELCIPNANDYREWDLDRMTVINDGGYEGTQIFIIPNNNYQPSVEDYVMTNAEYGSSSGGDTIKSISNYSCELPTDEQVRGYMTLALHLVQKLKWLGNKE